MKCMEIVTSRFYQALDALIATGQTKLDPFCKELGVDKRNFVKQQRDHSRSIIKLSWLTFLVEEYAVSADWLLTGKGAMFV